MSMFFFSSRRRHTRCGRDWSSDVCSSDLELVDEVARHCRGERGPSHQQCHGARVIGEEHGCLARRVTPADQKYVLAAYAGCLGSSRAVIDAASEKSVATRRLQLAPAYAGGENDAARADAFVAVETHGALALCRLGVDADDLPRHHDLGTEALGLLQRARAKLVARDACREAEII